MVHPLLTIKIKDNVVIIKGKEDTKKTKKFIHTFRAHIGNMLVGAVEGFEYQLKVCSGHFPMSVAVDKNVLVIKNFLGEKVPRKAPIMEGVNVKIEGDIIKVTGVDKEKVGQTAARIEQSTTISNRDRRIFQDGCYIINKAGKEI